MKFLSKTVLSVLLLLVSASFVSLEAIGIYNLCLDITTGLSYCLEYLNLISISLLALSILFLPLLLTLPLKPSVFEAWKRFAKWSMPLILVLVAWMESGEGGSGMPGGYHPGYLFYPIFVIIYFTKSFIIIFREWRKSRST